MDVLGFLHHIHMFASDVILLLVIYIIGQVHRFSESHC